MPMSLRLDRELEQKISRIAKRLKLKKAEIVRRSLTKFLVEMEERTGPYEIYQSLEAKIPASGHGSLSINHRAEVLKKLKAKKRS